MQDLLGATLILLAACSLAAVATAAFRVPALLGYLAVGALLGPSVSGVVAPGEALDFLSELGVALLLFMVGLEFSLGHFWLSRKTVLAAGSLQMIAVATPLTLMLMWLGQPVQSAALLSTAAAMSSTALVSRQLADQGAGDLGARRVAEDRERAARSVGRADVVRGSGPRLPSSVAWPAGLGGAAGPRRILRAGFLVRGGGCRRCCTRGRRIRRPGCVFGRHGAGRERLPSPHGKPPQTVSRCVVGGVLRDCRPAAGRSTDSFGTADGVGVAGSAGAGQDRVQYPGLAGDALVRPRCLAHGHSVGARWCSAWPWHRY